MASKGHPERPILFHYSPKHCNPIFWPYRTGNLWDRPCRVNSLKCQIDVGAETDHHYHRLTHLNSVLVQVQKCVLVCEPRPAPEAGLWTTGGGGGGGAAGAERCTATLSVDARRPPTITLPDYGNEGKGRLAGSPLPCTQRKPQQDVTEVRGKRAWDLVLRWCHPIYLQQKVCMYLRSRDPRAQSWAVAM